MTETLTVAQTERCERRFRAMGTTIVLAVAWDGSATAADAALADAEATVHDLERRWSRFRVDSELSQLNAAGGPTVVTQLTAELIAAACAAWADSEGWFDPTILRSLEALGYDRPFGRPTERRLDTSARNHEPPTPPPGCGAIACDPATGLVVLPHGCALDLGGIAKGATADLVTGELLDAGAVAACASIGGDVRVRSRVGAAPWPVAARVAGADATPVMLLDGAMCSSSTRRRRWRRGDTSHHHLVDPRFGANGASDVTDAAVVAGNAVTAEMLTKVAVLADGNTIDRLLDRHGAAAILRHGDGRRTRRGDWPDHDDPDRREVNRR